MSKLLELRGPEAPPRIAAALTILVGLISIGGWVFGAQSLTSVIPGAVSMKINTALAVSACGVALMLLARRVSASVDLTAQALGLAAACLGVVTLLEYFQGWDLKIDQLLVSDRTEAYNVFRGRMSPLTAAAFIAVGIALAVMPYARLKAVTQLGAAFALAVATVSLLGYLWRAGELVTDSVLPPLAVNTAACFVLLGAGILLAPRRSTLRLADRIGALPAIEAQTLAGFGLAFLLLIVGGGYTYRTNVEFANSVAWVSHTQDVRAALAALNGALAGAELAERDYLLTTDPAHLADCRRLAAEARQQLASLELLMSDNRVQRDNIGVLKGLVEPRLKDIEAGLDAFAASDLPAARAFLARTRDMSVTRQVPLQIGRMDELEAGYLHEREISTARVRHSTLLSLLVTLVAAGATFIALFNRIHREMRARRGAERALRGSEQYNRSIVDSSPDCLAVLNLDGQLDEMTEQGLRLMEADDFSAITHRDWLSWWTGPDRSAAQQALAAARTGAAGRFQGFCATRKGVAKWWDVIVRPIVGADGRPERLLAVARDVSDVKRAEDHLLETNRFLDSLIDNLPVTVVLKDAATLRYVRHNRAFERLLGYTRGELIGRTATSLPSLEEADSIFANDREVLDTGRLVEMEQSITTPDGVRTLHTMKVPVGDEDGKPRFLLAIAVDITERKLAEKAILELNAALGANAEQLKATNKELESFSYSVSHDLRAPLRAIDGFAMMIEEDCAAHLGDEGRRYLSVIRENSKRMGALIDDLLAFSRLGRLPVVTSEVDMSALVREVVAEIPEAHGAVRPQIELGSLPSAHVDSRLLRQVWANLLSNAVKYSSKVAQPRIEVSGRRDGIENFYSVRDNGIGFNMAYVDKLFGVFQRLHRADEFAGTGVGLAIVHRVITRHGGRVWAEGEIDRGAVFSFALPAGGWIGNT